MLPRGLLKEHSQILAIILRCLDGAAIVLAGWFAYFYKFDSWSLKLHYATALIISIFLTGIVFQFLDIYQPLRIQAFWKYITKLLQAVIILWVLLAGLAFLTKTGETYSRSWFGTWAIFSFTLLFVFRCGLLGSLRFMRSRGWNERRVIVIGAGELGKKIVETIQQSVWTGCRIVAILDDAPENKQKTISGISITTMPEDVSHYIASSKESIDEIWLALPLSAENNLKKIMYQLRHDTVTTRFFLDILGLDLLNHSITNLAGFPALNIRCTPMVGLNRFVKAMEDRILASLILILISPLFLVIAILVKLSSPGPIFYRQKRLGWNGVEFEMLKFRTMPVEAESKTGPVWAKPNEKRATKIGAFLRRTSLDELPQFINVVKGDMSIVGPRPERMIFVEQFKNQIPRYMQKHMVKAGITGWAQVNGWRGNTSLEKRIEYDLYYIENWSLNFDLKIIFMTLFSGFINKNAY